MSAENTQQVLQRTGEKFTIDSFRGVKLAAQEPWLYGVWYFGISIVAAFLSGFLWTPIAISQYGLQYDQTLQQYILSPTGELFRSGAQVVTFLSLFAVQLVAMIRTAYVGHSQHYLLQTIRFDMDSYLNVPLIVDQSNVQNWDDKAPDLPGHKSLVPITIPQTLPYRYKIANLFIHDPKKKWRPYQPFDYELLVHPGDTSQTFRYARGKAPFMSLLLNCPDTLPIGTTVYYGKRYEKNGKLIPVMFVHDSPYSAFDILKAAKLTGVTKDELGRLDDLLDAHTAMDKDYQIDQLSADLTRERIAHRQEQGRNDSEIADDNRWVRGGLDDKPVNGFQIKLFGWKGLLALGLFSAICMLVFEAFRTGFFK
jgi:hypothetical protein